MKEKPYVVSHVRAALAADPEVGSLDIVVDVTGDTIYISGVIDCESKRQAAGQAAARAAPGLRVVNDLKVLQLTPVEPAEVLNDTSGGHR